MPCTSIRGWWETTASGAEQAVVLAHAGFSIHLAGVPWTFLPAQVQAALAARFAYTPQEKPVGRAG